MRNLSMSFKMIMVGAASMLAACTSVTMAPGYERPAAPIAAALPQADEDAVSALIEWRDVFPDPELRAVIETALVNNRNLRVAVLNVERARALYRVQRSESLPTITAGGDYSRQRFGENAAAFGAGGVGLSPGGGQGPITIEQFNATAAVSAYELDLFGRVRSLNRQALETFLATEEGRKAAEISLIAEVANAYLRLGADRELLAIARDTLANQQAALDLTSRLAADGVGNDVDVQRVSISIERARADAAALEAQVAQDENALRLLAGATDTALTFDVHAIDDVEIDSDFAVGASSAVLLSRPDVLAAERRLKAANANIGAARAAFFPRILLTASAGAASTELTDLFAPGTGVWRFAPSISIPIFTGGRNRAQLKGANIDRDIAIAEYEGSIQTAFRETADALATRATIDERLDAVAGLSTAAGTAFDLTNMRFENGVDDYFAVLDAQRTDYAARQELIAVQLVKAMNTVQLFRALGCVSCSAMAGPL
ncbi:MAG: efflux transporter outer membrane subunit [Parvularculaceae bacterium]|nr:efflux transporter outer membrane subunit [Parvularculaceae bacterium]